jgi:hypothetical protein
MSSDRIVASDPEILDSGGTSVPSIQHIDTCYLVEERRVGVDVLAFKDSGGAFRERDSGRVKVARPKSRED